MKKILKLNTTMHKSINKISIALLINILIIMLFVNKNPITFIISTILSLISYTLFFKETKIKKEKVKVKNAIIFGFIIIAISSIGLILSERINDIIELFGCSFSKESLEALKFNKGLYYSLVMGIYVIILAPISEEIIFRGYILENLKKYGNKPAIIISALLFALFHMQYYQFLPAVLSGLLLGILYIKYNSIKLPIAAHMINNIISLINAELSFDLNFILIIFGIILLILNKEKIKIKKDKKLSFKLEEIFKSIPLILFVTFTLLILFLNLKVI